MTAIPDASEEDFEYVAYLKELFSNDQIPFDWIGHPESRRMLRLLSHYQRENERLARQRDVLAMEFVRTHSMEDVQNWERRYQSGDRSDYAIRMHNVFDALTGEGGAG